MGSGSRALTLVFGFALARVFFSAAMSRALLWLAAGDLADQIRLLHVAVLDRDVVAVLLEDDVAALDRADRALEPAPPCDRDVDLYLRFLADEARELLRREQRPVDARRRDLERVAALDRIVDVERRADLAADRLAILDRDRPPRRIDVDPHERVGLVRRVLDPEQLEPERRDDRLQQFVELVVLHSRATDAFS